ncbi:transglutaminase domain-containing protein [Methanolacinia petrolearia]|uniref:transglutaminase domain-containing protein n=1 Tax=Methanolacinia petrolearia TaxID=54120 RepID=UPI003BAC7A32
MKDKDDKEKIQIRLNYCLFMTFGIILGIGLGSVSFTDITNEKLNNYFSIIYDREIEPYGDAYINGIVDEVNSLNGTHEKLNYIAEKDIENFTNFYWETEILNNSEFSFIPIGLTSSAFKYDPNGNIRAVSSSYYQNNATWISYYKTGACGELVVFFYEVANRSGFVVRPVHANFITGGNHAWVEVLIDGEWWYFDPTIYGQLKLKGDSIENIWFNKPVNYPWFENQMTEVWVPTTGEDRTDFYPSYHLVKIPEIPEELLIVEKRMKEILNIDYNPISKLF